MDRRLRHKTLAVAAGLLMLSASLLTWTIATAPEIALLLEQDRRPGAFDRLESATLASRPAAGFAPRVAAPVPAKGPSRDDESTLWGTRMAESLNAALARGDEWLMVKLYGTEGVSSSEEYRQFLGLVQSGGEPAKEALGELFRSTSNGSLRSILVMAMGDLKAEQHLPLVSGTAASGLRSGARAIYESALFGLSRMDSPGALAALRGLTETQSPTWQWSRELHLAMGSYGAEALDLLVAEAERMAEEDAPLEPHLVLGSLRGPGAYSALESFLEGSPSEETRRMALYALGASATPEEEALLLQRLESADEADLEALVCGLGSRKDDATARVLQAWLESVKEPLQAALAVDALMGDLTPEATGTLLGILDSAGGWGRGLAADPAVEKNLIIALGVSHDPRAHAALHALYGSADTEKRGHIIAALEGTLDGAWGPLLLGRLGEQASGDPQELAQTVRALLRVEGDQASHLRSVVELLSSSQDPASRRQVLAALGGNRFTGAQGCPTARARDQRRPDGASDRGGDRAHGGRGAQPGLERL